MVCPCVWLDALAVTSPLLHPRYNPAVVDPNIQE